MACRTNRSPNRSDAAAEIAATETLLARLDRPVRRGDRLARRGQALTDHAQALTDRETGGIIAAPTTSLPEVIGGRCNWDYRYSWLRDSTFTLTAFLNAGFHEEARAWRDWLLRAAAGGPDRLRTMYRVDGARHIATR